MTNTQISTMLAYIREANKMLDWTIKLAGLPGPNEIETNTEFGTIKDEPQVRSSHIL